MKKRKTLTKSTPRPVPPVPISNFCSWVGALSGLSFYVGQETYYAHDLNIETLNERQASIVEVFVLWLA